ncbi:DEKNAAC103148 [Brettanomyces naardenensis]|uniref:DEKNAAC103148 n=1 Tax=Brettanomyces naardenensis TaxID=13370 RepID=A0A448YMG8_BRENA|nr:DEKNAAC103148 [Brettanomyces naardenensis]
MTGTSSPSKTSPRPSTSKQSNVISPKVSNSSDVLSYRLVELDDEQGSSDDDFIRKYGDVNVKYIRKPPIKSWGLFNKPYPLNYFYNGTLFRTRESRGESGKTELFLDLAYVGIVSKLASTASGEADGRSLLIYVLLFCPVWQVWTDISLFMNYYFTEDLSQKLYIIWILALLVVYCNATNYLLESNSANALVIVPYILSRLSFSLSLMLYSIWIPHHRPQNLLYATSIIVTCCLWIPVIFVPVKVKIGLAFMNIFLEDLFWVISYHPIAKKLMKLKYSTALNIEHEVERIGAFYVIAIGEFSFNVVATTADRNYGLGVTEKVGRAIMLLIISYLMMWMYFNGDGSFKAVHAIRRGSNTAWMWMLAHMPLISSLILAADAASDISYQETYIEEGEKGLSFFFTGGIAVSMISLFFIAMLDKSLDDCGQSGKVHRVVKIWRLLPRVIGAIVILCLSFADNLRITSLFAIVMCILALIFIYEVMMSQDCGCPNAVIAEENAQQAEYAAREAEQVAIEAEEAALRANQ